MKSMIYDFRKKNYNMSINKIIVVLACMASMSIYSQKRKVARANKDYNKFAYVDAIKTYERVYEKGYKTQEVLQNLGNAYYFKAELDKAAKWYGELFELTQDVEPEYYYRYAQSLKAVKDYIKADQMMALFNQKSGNDHRAKLAEAQKNYLEVIKKNSGRYTIANAGVNSPQSDYGSAFFGTKVVFASARDTGGLAARKHNWTNEGFTNLFAADMGENGTLTDAKKFGGKLNSKYHEATPVFTKDGKTVYFTRNNFNNGKKGEAADETILLKIYRATLEGDKWTNITELPFNSNEYAIAHPALSKDEKTLYFASNMPGTLGQSDIFKVAINGDGSFGTPKNLGNVINTEGRETFPFVDDNELYFASDGHPGLGGLDVFVSKAQKDGTYKEVLNVGEPVNASTDDFGFIINTENRKGYVTSNRGGGQGGDDIYGIKENERLWCEQLLSGVVTDKDSGLPVANAKVTLTDSSFKFIAEATTDAEGKFDFGIVSCDTKFYIKTEKTEYTTVETPTITGAKTGKTIVPIAIEKTIKQVTLGDDLSKKIKLNIIYFDLDKSDIREDAAMELTKILAALEQNPTMEIDIRSHTDCRQTAKYNMGLSDRRAKSTKAWLVKNGINTSRITAKGYGESQLVNNCPCEPKNESNCSEEEHQANRRSEFIITKL